MSEPFLAELRCFSFSFAPRGWALCNGQLLPINQNQTLFSLLGTTYGGNGQTNFALPNLQGRTPVHAIGGQLQMGQSAGTETVTLTTQQMPTHSHGCMSNAGTANIGTPVNNTWGTESTGAYAASSTGNMNATAIGNAGNSQPHVNLQPFLTINFCIALQGVFPSQN